MIGTTISHYRILAELGRGGMGVVYKAEDTKLERTVALKLLPSGILASDEDRERFYREARAAAALHHPNVATVFEIDDVPGPGGEPQPFIAIEFVDGESLSDVIERAPLPADDAIAIMAQLADGLHAAHEKGIVHRDIKPANIMMSSDGRPKILDFGVARLEREAALTQTGSTIGTTAYMSPEQVRGEPVDRRSDLWSLGVVFHELLAGARPFQGDYEAAITFAILNEDPKIGERVPDELRGVLGRLLSKHAADRYQSAQELAADLRSGGTTLQPPPRLPASTAAPTSDRPRSPVSRRTILAAAVGILIVVAAAVVYFLSPADQIESIAVLPFRNAGEDPDLEYLSDGLTETLINSLSQVPDLRVMARSTVFQYKGRPVTPGEVGEDLDVRAVLVGDIIQRGEDLRINAELVDVADGAQLWGGSFNQPISDIIQIQDALAGRILDGLRVRL
ncbi:MAG: serine/threonine-protein kinase, partial [Rhodothermales bacterium]|nr:serine/threonine-protein kinase [Rhodothermales bacterium]